MGYACTIYIVAGEVATSSLKESPSRLPSQLRIYDGQDIRYEGGGRVVVVMHGRSRMTYDTLASVNAGTNNVGFSLVRQTMLAQR